MILWHRAIACRRRPFYNAPIRGWRLMNEKPESEEFDEEEEEPTFEATSEVDFDRLAKDLDAAKKRGQKLGDPAWRKLERRLEDKNTAELTSDFDDYNIEDDSTAVRKMNKDLG